MQQKSAACGEPTEKQLQLLRWIERFIQYRQYSPSLREMMLGMNLHSTQPIQERLRILRRLGLISWNPGIPRTVKVLKPQNGSVQIEGVIAAGPTATVFLSTPEKLDLPDAEPGDFALIVKDDSLSGAMIRQGDTALFRKVDGDIDDGAIVAFQSIYNKDIKIRRYFQRGDRIRLVGANKSYLDLSFGSMSFGANEVSILGVLIGVWRRYD